MRVYSPYFPKDKNLFVYFIVFSYLCTRFGNAPALTSEEYQPRNTSDKQGMNINDKRPLLGQTLDNLKKIVSDLSMPRFTAKQIAVWLYKKHCRDIDEMTDISLKNRDLLKEHFTLGCKEPVEVVRSVDGTAKYLYQTAEGDYIECVYIPEDDRATLCVSSQVGCRMACKFCMTGRQGCSGNLTAADILNQLYSLPESEKITNIVFMGQGEPMNNLDNVLDVLQVLTSDYGYAWSPKRITVSTVGIRGGLERFLNESDCHLAISLHSPYPSQRAEFMPAERIYSITEMLALLRQYDFSKQRRLSFEYILFKGLNADLKDAEALVKLLRGVDCRVNLIRFHTIPDTEFKGTDTDTMVRFRDYLTSHGVFSTIRASRGQDIWAACGLLSTKKQQEQLKKTTIKSWTQRNYV